MTITTEEFESRPRARLLELLDRRGLKLGDFALRARMAEPPPPGWTGKLSPRAEHRQRCLVKIRTYTHGPRYTPPADMIVRWAEALGVDPGYFWSSGQPTPEAQPERRPKIADALAAVPSTRRLLAIADALGVAVAAEAAPELREELAGAARLEQLLPVLTRSEWLRVCDAAGLADKAARSRGGRVREERAQLLGVGVRRKRR